MLSSAQRAEGRQSGGWESSKRILLANKRDTPWGFMVRIYRATAQCGGVNERYVRLQPLLYKRVHSHVRRHAILLGLAGCTDAAPR